MDSSPEQPPSGPRRNKLGGRNAAEREHVLRDKVTGALEKEPHANAPADLDDHPLVGERALGQRRGECAGRRRRRQQSTVGEPLSFIIFLNFDII